MSLEHYFERFGFCGRQIATPPAPDLGIVVVIPCYNEPDLIGSLESLRACDRPTCAVEVIVVINSPADCASEVRTQNQTTLTDTMEWAAGHGESRFAVHTLHFPALPKRQAGVGLARKIGMDEAAWRFADAKRFEGIILGFDADCRCDPDYLSAVERSFTEHPESPGGVVYFEHPLEGPLPARVYDAVAAYELHLRYYVRALRHAGFPHAHQTIGSCMAVRAATYTAQGGMNKRRAGEDFYFLQKIIPLGGFIEVNSTRVVPSPRISDRVPFGTGKAVGDYLKRDRLDTYRLETFHDLKALFGRVPDFFSHGRCVDDPPWNGLPESVRSFLAANDFVDAIRQIRGNTASETAFRNRFFRWFNPFAAMKFAHHARDRFYGEGNVQDEAARLLDLLSVRPEGRRTARELLEVYRKLDRFAGDEV